MITINLLPSKKHPFNLSIKRFLLFFLLIVILFTVSSLICQREINRLEEALAKIKADIASYNKVVEEIKNIKKKQKDIIIRTDIIKGLTKNRLTVLNLLNSVSQNISAQRMWLTNISINKNMVNIQGVVIDNKTAADFMKRLESTGCFFSVNLRKLKRGEAYADLSLKIFEIYCSIKKDEKKDNL